LSQTEQSFVMIQEFASKSLLARVAMNILYA
jgi:hypothetical protein